MSHVIVVTARMQKSRAHIFLPMIHKYAQNHVTVTLYIILISFERKKEKYPRGEACHSRMRTYVCILHLQALVLISPVPTQPAVE
jgi:hypothetical protein